MGDMSPADIAAVTDGERDGFGGGGMWIFALLILFAIMGGGFGGYNRGAAGEPVTEAGLCNAMNFNNLENAVGRLGDQINGVNTNLGNAVCQLGYETLSNFNSLERQLADCCCTIQRGIDSVNYNAAMNTAAINANTTAGVQKGVEPCLATRNYYQYFRRCP